MKLVAHSILWLTPLIALSQEAVQGVKAPVPPKADRKQIAREIRDLFKVEYAKRDRESRQNFAKTLLAQGETTRATAQRFVLLTEALDLAAGAMDLETVSVAITKITDLYDLKAAGAGFTPTSLKVAALKKARKAAKLEDVTIHDLRRTHSTQAVVAGVDLRTLAGRLGHANLSMLEKHYAVLVGSASEEAAEKIEEAFAQGAGESPEEAYEEALPFPAPEEEASD